MRSPSAPIEHPRIRPAADALAQDVQAVIGRDAVRAKSRKRKPLEFRQKPISLEECLLGRILGLDRSPKICAQPMTPVMPAMNPRRPLEPERTFEISSLSSSRSSLECLISHSINSAWAKRRRGTISQEK